MIDSVIVKYKHIQKVETIGDAYMVVGNMDTPTEYQPETYLEMVLFANELLTKIAHIGIPDRTIRLRIGIHAGSFVISFYGKIRPRLCVIGKHVNIAARIQSTAAPNTIHISKEMYGHILAYTNSSPPNSHTPEFSYCLNRDVELKHIGKVDTYTIRLSA
jgi:class 3 adenylate cyclase